MEELSKLLDQHWAAFVAMAGGIGVIATLMSNIDKIREWIRKRSEARKARKQAPVKTLQMLSKMQANIERIDSSVNQLTDKVEKIDNDTGDLLCSQITREREYYIRLGYCPDSDKRRLEDIYNRYKSRGRNHVAECYMDDILKLPPVPGALQVTMR